MIKRIDKKYMRSAHISIVTIMIMIYGCNDRYDVDNMRNQACEAEVGNGHNDILLIIEVDGPALKFHAEKNWGILRPGGPSLVQLNTGESRAHLVVDDKSLVTLPLFTGTNSIMLKNVSAEAKCKVVLTGDREYATRAVNISMLQPLSTNDRCNIYTWNVP